MDYLLIKINDISKTHPKIITNHNFAGIILNIAGKKDVKTVLEVV